MFQLQLFCLLHCNEWDHVVALPRHKFVTGATLLQLDFFIVLAHWTNRPQVDLSLHWNTSLCFEPTSFSFSLMLRA